MFDDGYLDDPLILERYDALLRFQADAGARVRREAVSTAEDVTRRITKLKSEDRRNALLMIADKTGALRFVTVRID